MQTIDQMGRITGGQARCYMKESRSSMMAILYFLLHHHYSSNIFGRLKIKLYLCTINF